MCTVCPARRSSSPRATTPVVSPWQASDSRPTRSVPVAGWSTARRVAAGWHRRVRLRGCHSLRTVTSPIDLLRDGALMTDALDQLASELLAASRALLAITTRALGTGAPELTLVQYRCLVVLALEGPTATTALAVDVGVHQSTVTRATDQARAQGVGRAAARRHRPQKDHGRSHAAGRGADRLGHVPPSGGHPGGPVEDATGRRGACGARARCLHRAGGHDALRRATEASTAVCQQVDAFCMYHQDWGRGRVWR